MTLNRQLHVLDLLTIIAVLLVLLGTTFALVDEYAVAQSVLLVAVAVTGYAVLYTSVRL